VAQVRVWRADATCEHTLDACAALLSPAEAARAARMRHERSRREFAVGRGLLRRCLAESLARAPESLEFSISSHGKPLLAGAPAPECFFNLSHSGGVVLLALCPDAAVGVDLECLGRDVDWRGLAIRFFSEAEVQALEALPEERAREGFFACWTRKEALVKAQGHGIAGGLASFDVSVDPDAPARLLDARGEQWSGRSWSLADLAAGPRHRASVAVAAPKLCVRLIGDGPGAGPYAQK
jgi:4'-phosphopantetheinyl transferase